MSVGLGKCSSIDCTQGLINVHYLMVVKETGSKFVPQNSPTVTTPQCQAQPKAKENGKFS